MTADLDILKVREALPISLLNPLSLFERTTTGRSDVPDVDGMTDPAIAPESRKNTMIRVLLIISENVEVTYCTEGKCRAGRGTVYKSSSGSLETLR